MIYETLPNDLPLVAGVITSTPQTPLSHVNLRAQQNGIANAYLNNAAGNPKLKKLIGKPVQLVVGPDDFEVRQVTTTALHSALAARRPSDPQFPNRDLGPRKTVVLDDLRWTDADAFGAKVANLAELRRMISHKLVPNGFAIPFSFYDEFMIVNGLYDHIRTKMDNPAFKGDEQRRDMLKAIRRAIKSAMVPAAQRNQFDLMQRGFPTGTTLRCRSSANNEDLLGFSGAGLYNSYTHRLDEGSIEKFIKQVWASLWNFHAFEERAFFRVDQITAAMGVLVHPNFDNEKANGVALTRNIYFPQFEGCFVNAQVGENLVTNPKDTVSAEEVLVLEDINLGNNHIYEPIYIRRSSLSIYGVPASSIRTKPSYPSQNLWCWFSR